MAKIDGESSSEPAPVTAIARDLPIGQGWSLVCTEIRTGLALRLQHPDRTPFLVEIALTPAGPVIRAQAAALELAASDSIVARCETFSLQARKAVTIGAPVVRVEATAALHAEGPQVDLMATRGDLSLRANDDVKVLGEKILLNCERDPPVPAWIATAATVRDEVLLPRVDRIGELALSNAASGKE